MAEAIPQKYYEYSGGGVGPNNANMVAAAPGYNTPYGATEISYDDFVSKSKSTIADGKTGQTLYDQQYAKNPSWFAGPNQSSGYVKDPVTGNLTTQSAIDQEASYKAGVANGSLKEIEPGKYVPTGSAGDPSSAMHNVPVGAVPAGSTTPTTAQNGTQQAPGVQGATAQQQALQMPANGSVVDLLNAAGQDSSFAARQQLAAQFGIQAYQGSASQNQELAKKFLDAFNAKKGTQAPQSGADARGALSNYFDEQNGTPVDPQKSFIDAFAGMNPIENQLYTMLSQLSSPQSNQQTFSQLYAEEMAKSGIPALSEDLAQVMADIDMTEDNIREELSRGGGVVLESQVRGIAAARSKALLVKANQLQNIINSRRDYVDQIVSLTKADREQASEDFDRKIGLTKMMYDITTQMQDRARENYQSVIKDIGYDGLVDSVKSPAELTRIASALGMSPQTLLQLSTQKTSAQRAQELEQLNYNLSVDKFNEDKRQFGLQYALESYKAKQQYTASSIVSPYQTEKTTRNIASIDSILPKVSAKTVGAGSYLSYIPGSSARDFNAEVDALKANIAFSELTAMREASKTGGALGAISDRELTLLQSSLGSLDTKQSPEAFKKSLSTVKENIYRWNAQALSVGKGFDYDDAKKSGYTDEEIFNYLNK